MQPSGDAGLEERGVYMLFGAINSEGVQRIIRGLIAHAAVKGRKKRTITILINSDGGDLTEAFALIDVIAGLRERLTVNTYGMGSVCSAALLIFLAGEKRIITPNTMVMSHPYSDPSKSGQHYALVASRKGEDIAYKLMLNHYVAMTGTDARTVKRELLGPVDVWLTPADCIKYGIAHDVALFGVTK